MGNSYWVTDPRAKGGRILVQTTEPTARQKKSAAKQQKEFAKVPLQWAADMAKVTRTPGAMVWILLGYLAWKNHSLTFPLSNEVLRRYGINRETKRRILTRLKVSGRIKIEQHHKRSPSARFKNQSCLNFNNVELKSVT